MKLLLAIDSSPQSRRAATYAGRLAPHVPGCEVVLFSVLSGIPSDAPPGAVPPSEKPELHGDVDEAREFGEVQALLQEVTSLLHAEGLPANRLQTVAKPLRRGIALDILDEAAAHGCDTIVVGRRSQSRTRELLQGSISRELLQKSADLALWIILE